jgi:hypothetical protein
MRPHVLGTLLASLAIMLAASSGVLRAQQAQRNPFPRRNQVALGVGISSGEVSYARRIGENRLSLGGGIWLAWEPPHSFDHDVWQPLGVAGVVRYHFSPYVQTEAGPAYLTYLGADDCSSCSGTLVGLRAAARAGYRFLFVGPSAWIGWSGDQQNSSQFGAIFDLQIIVNRGWGR